jgi:glycosyltransferase involved in cell wall biosynthesis
VRENKLDSHVEFIDKIPHNELVHFYNSLDLFVLPSYYEAFGCVYLEAHACGIPFIAVEGQGIAELILPENKDKQLIQKADSVYLSSLISYYAENKSFFPSLSINYDIETLMQKLVVKIDQSR